MPYAYMQLGLCQLIKPYGNIASHLGPAVQEKREHHPGFLIHLFVRCKPWCSSHPNASVPVISLGDIHNMPTLWVLALFGIFYKFCFHVQTCRHLGGGGGYVYTF